MTDIFSTLLVDVAFHGTAAVLLVAAVLGIAIGLKWVIKFGNELRH